MEVVVLVYVGDQVYVILIGCDGIVDMIGNDYIVLMIFNWILFEMLGECFGVGYLLDISVSCVGIVLLVYSFSVVYFMLFVVVDSE